MSNTINKIIFLLDVPLDKRFFNLLGVNTLIHNGFDVEIWDFTPFFHKEFIGKIVIDGHMVFEKCRKFDNKRDIKCALSEISPNTVVNSIISYRAQSFFIYHRLSALKIKYCVLQMVSLPPSPPLQKKGSSGFFISVIKRAVSLKPKHVFFGLCDKALLRYYPLFGIRSADLALLSGERSLEIARDPIDAKTHLIWAHLWDYDVYINERNNQITADPSVGVFLDEYYPLHTDLDYLGISSPIEADEYYAKMRTFFDYLEKNYHVRIIIAAHPRSDYPETSDYFGRRPVIKGQTARLVHESSFVLAHDSISINFAILFRKPVIFMTMDKMQTCEVGRLTTALSIEAMASALKKKPINLDSLQEFNWIQEIQVDMQSYMTYQNDIIKKNGTPEIPFWEIYIQSLRQIYP